jgi:hypothetical protein
MATITIILAVILGIILLAGSIALTIHSWNCLYNGDFCGWIIMKNAAEAIGTLALIVLKIAAGDNN